VLNRQQVKLLQIAVKAAGLRTKESEGRYRMLLGQYKQPSGKPVTSSVQLNRHQFEDILALCEAMGWSYPGKDAKHYRNLVYSKYDTASLGKQGAIKNMAGDMGWKDEHLAGFIKRMTHQAKDNVCELSPYEADRVIEALKQILGRRDGRQYTSIDDVAAAYSCNDKEATDGQSQESHTVDCHC
jgi:hypothetical protein